MSKCRYNIDTANADLIQIDLNDWKLLGNSETVFFTVVSFSEDPEKPSITASIPVCRADLMFLRDKISEIID